MKLEKGDRVRVKYSGYIGIVGACSKDLARVSIDDGREYIPSGCLELVESFKDMKKGIKSSIQVFREDAEAMHKTVLHPENQNK